MDLQNITADTQTLEIRHPGTGKPTGLSLDLASNESDAVKAVSRRQLDKSLRSRKHTITAAELEANNNERLIAAVVGWSWKGDASWGGHKLEFTKENVAAVMTAPWVRSQVEEVLRDEAGFFLS